MIKIPQAFKDKVHPFNKDFIRLVDFFNQLEKDLEYPNCEGYMDQERVLSRAQNELIMWGKV